MVNNLFKIEVMVYFSDLFNVDESVIKDYGAMNISLLNDIPLFIDPFLLYASEKPEYRQLHERILDYLSFLRDKASGNISLEKIKRWYTFPEVKQNWLGYSESGNGGLGLGKDFGQSMSKAIQRVFPELKNETITETSHLEKLSLFRVGVGRDNISDFTCNLIKEYLLEYTQTFAKQYLLPEQCKNVSVPKVYFDYKFETWMPQIYTLPYFNDDYVILTPKDILTKDETWINASEMRYRLLDITSSIPNEELRDRINGIYLKQLPDNKITEKSRNEAAANTIAQFPELMDYYIKIKEEEKAEAKSASNEIVSIANEIYVSNIQTLIKSLDANYQFYKENTIGSYDASLDRVMFLKDFIENKDGYKLFYHNGKPIKKEKDLQLIFKLTWFATKFDVNAEVNNGRGPVDYKISKGNTDKTLVEFKLASNSKLKHNIANQVKVYEAANNTNQSIKVILYFSNSEYLKVHKILEDLNLLDSNNIILIDACNNKISASNVK